MYPVGGPADTSLPIQWPLLPNSGTEQATEPAAYSLQKRLPWCSRQRNHPSGGNDSHGAVMPISSPESSLRNAPLVPQAELR